MVTFFSYLTCHVTEFRVFSSGSTTINPWCTAVVTKFSLTNFFLQHVINVLLWSSNVVERFRGSSVENSASSSFIPSKVLSKFEQFRVQKPSEKTNMKFLRSKWKITCKVLCFVIEIQNKQTKIEKRLVYLWDFWSNFNKRSLHFWKNG